MKKRYSIGIDPGTHTGLAVWDSEKKGFLILKTCTLLQAVDTIRTQAELIPEQATLYVENPNLRSWFGQSDRERLQGAGSVKRDFAIWQEFAQAHGFELVPVHPRHVQNMSGERGVIFFQRLTGDTRRTSVHAREAAIMVYNI